MEQIFSGLKAVSGKTKVEVTEENVCPELYGKFTLTKGTFKQIFSYWAKVYKHATLEKVAFTDEYEHDLQATFINDCPIDSISNLTEMLRNSGMSTVANTLCFNDDEIRDAMFNIVQKHKMFKEIFGKDAKLRQLIPKDDYLKMLLADVIQNYDTRTQGEKSNYLFGFDSVIGEPTLEPTLEQLIKKLNSLG